MEIWPAIDLLDGAAVRLHQGDYAQVTVYDKDPTAIAERFSGRSERLHVVDLEGARSGTRAQAAAVKQLVKAFGPGIELGGGIRDFEAVKECIDLGVSRVVLGTAALKNPDLIWKSAETFPNQIVLAVDAKRGMVATEGWQEVSSVKVSDLVRKFEKAELAAILYTDISRDGTQVGPNVDATANLARATRHGVLASGGVGSLDHIRHLKAQGCIRGVVIGKALYEGSFQLEEALEIAASLASS